MAIIERNWLAWLYQREQGWTTREIAEAAQRAERTIRHGIQKAREWRELQEQLKRLAEGDILLQMIGVTGRQCDHSRPISFSGTTLCLDCWHTNNPRRTNWGEPIGGIVTSEHQPKGKPKFIPAGLSKAKKQGKV